MSRWLFGAVTCLVVWSASLPATRAQDLEDRPRPSAEARRRAIELYEQSRYALRSGEFEEARDLLVEAYALHPQPALRASLGRAYDGLGDAAHAIEQYEAYLEENPDAADQGEIEGRLVELRERLREEQGAPEPPPPPRRSGPDETGPLVGFTLAGFGVAALVAGGVLAGVAASDNATSRRASTTQLEAQAAYSRGRDLGIASIVLLGAGGALALAGVVVALVAGEEAPSGPAPAPRARLQLGLGSLAIEGSF